MFNRVLSGGITVNTVTNACKTITNVIDDAGNLIKTRVKHFETCNLG